MAVIDQAIGILTTADDGTRVAPESPAEWAGWVSAGSTRNHLRDDALGDWLDLYGKAAGFTPDRDLPGADPRTDFSTFIFAQGHAFEAGVLRLIGERWPLTTIATGREDSRRLETALATVEAMRAGAPVIAQGVLRNPTERAYGLADLIVRSDVLAELVPGTLTPEEAAVAAPGLDGPWHYRVIDVKFKTLHVTHDGRLRIWKALAEAAQVSTYNEALGRLQGYVAPAAYLLGRSCRAKGTRGTNCFERLARVDRDSLVDVRSGVTLATRTSEARDWVRRVRTEGAGWSVLPVPSVPELYPNLKVDSYGWSSARARIAAEVSDLTMLPAVTSFHRAAAHAAGVMSWSDERTSTALLGVREEAAARCDTVLAANRSSVPVVLPDRIEGDTGGWRTPAPLEFYVDFETTLDLDDDFSTLPDRGGTTLIFQIGCGRWNGAAWEFEQWTVDRLAMADERTVIERFIAHVDGLRTAAGLEWDQVRLVHWFRHEPGTFDTYGDSARTRHGDPDWPILPWFDFLEQVVQPAALAVTGAFSQSLKPLVKSMHAMGLLETTWEAGPGDGNAAMVGAWWCEHEAARTGGSIQDLALMDGIKAYNEVDCRAMAELIRWLRENR